jgi:hypothetical protein
VDDEPHVLARLDRIGALDRSGAPAETLLAELRGLLRDAGAPTREADAGASGKEVVERPRTAPLGT